MNTPATLREAALPLAMFLAGVTPVEASGPGLPTCKAAQRLVPGYLGGETPPDPSLVC